ncbi:hypothetical protein CsatB_024762 [Cannabis sativa]
MKKKIDKKLLLFLSCIGLIFLFILSPSTKQTQIMVARNENIKVELGIGIQSNLLKGIKAIVKK